jgi:hypothetical protein
MKITSLFISLFFFSLLGSSQDENPGSDTTRVSLGGGTEIIIIKNSDDVDEASAETPDSLNTEKKHGVDMQKFTYWAGIDLGVSTLLMTDQVKDENEWLDIDEKQSISFSLNVIEKKIPLIKHYLGLNTGLGFTWQNFEFNDSLSIVNLSGDSIVGLSAAPLEYEKNRLKVAYLKIPILLEINTSKHEEKNFHIAAGFIAGWNYRTVFKQKYELDSDTVKSKVKGGYNVNPFSLEASARVGYGDLTLFASASLTGLFEEDKGPTVYPFTVGLTVLAF